MKMVITRSWGGLFAGLLAAFAASGQATSPQVTSPGVSVRTVAEVEIKTLEDGRLVAHLAPADRAVPGDEVLYTLEVRNPGVVAIPAPEVVFGVPPHMTYLADTAAGPGAEVTFSVDSGQTFDRPEYLKATGPDGVVRIAVPSLYTHIRWKFKHSLKPKSVAFARFRVQVK